MTFEELLPEDRRGLLLTIGSHKKHRPKLPMWVADKLSDLRSSHSIDQICEFLVIADSSLVTKFISLKNLPDELQGLVRWGASAGYLSFSTAAQIARLEDRDAILYLAKAALENSLTRNEVRAIYQISKKQDLSIPASVQQIIETRPKIEDLYLFMGHVLDQARAVAANPDAKDLLRKGLAKLVGAGGVQSVSIKDGKFSFILNETAKDSSGIQILFDSDKLESVISSILLEE